MRFGRLQLKNFRHHVDTDIEFQSGLTAIVGKNGSGKTTLLEGIGYALYGTAALLTPQDDMPCNLVFAEGKTEVRFGFSHGDSYQIVREPGSACRGRLVCLSTQLAGLPSQHQPRPWPPGLQPRWSERDSSRRPALV